MSVENLKPGSDLHRLCAHGLEWVDCFFCGDQIAGIAVVWSGGHGPIALHPSCAKDLACELIGDARNAIRVIEGKSLAAGVNEE